MLAFRAQYIFPVCTPPLRDAVVAIDRNRIAAVGPRSSPAMRDFAAAAHDLGHVAILPGLVNPHTHLEFSNLPEPLGTPGMAFPDWIRQVVNHRRQHPASPADDPIACGLAESTRFGVTSLGEIASTPWWPENSQPIEITEFIECIALKPDRIEAKFAETVDALLPDRAWSASFLPGFSPHAPYTVHPELVRSLVKLSAERRIPLAHHLAESREELALLRGGDGPLADLLKDFGQWDPAAIPRNSRPLDYLQMLAAADRALVIHGNYLVEEEIDFLAKHADRMSLIYCPRTHAFFRHDTYPLAKMLNAGVNMAIGTDSRASAPDLNLLAEMRFAAGQHRDVSPAALLRLITSAAAKALGRDREIGAIAEGKFADLALVQLPDHAAADPHELLLDPACRAVATIFRGNVVHWGLETELTTGNS